MLAGFVKQIVYLFYLTVMKVAGKFLHAMSKKAKKLKLSLEDFARKGGLARAQKYSKQQRIKWGKLGGRPKKK